MVAAQLSEVLRVNEQVQSDIVKQALDVLLWLRAGPQEVRKEIRLLFAQVAVSGEVQAGLESFLQVYYLFIRHCAEGVLYFHLVLLALVVDHPEALHGAHQVLANEWMHLQRYAVLEFLVKCLDVRPKEHVLVQLRVVLSAEERKLLLSDL